MSKAYLAVLNAYWSSWGFRTTCGLVVLCFAPAYFKSNPQDLSLWPTLPVILAASLFAFSIAGLTKEHFSKPSARITPRFNERHWVVAGTMVVCALLLTAGLLAWVTACGFLGAASVMTAVFAFAAWGVCLNPIVLLVFVALVYACAVSSRGAELFTDLMCDQYPVINITTLVLGLISLGVAGRKLSRLYEDQRTYAAGFAIVRLGWEPLETTQGPSRGLSHWWLRVKERQLDGTLTRPVRRGLWHNAARLHAAGDFIPCGLVTVAVLVTSWTASKLIMPGLPLIPQMAPIALLVMLASWRQATRKLSQEAARPVDRGTLLQQYGLILLTDLLKVWLTVAIMTGLVWAVLSPELLANMSWWRLFGFALCALPLFLGLSSLSLRLRSELGFWCAGISLYMVSMVGIAATIRDNAPAVTESGGGFMFVTIWAGGLLSAGALVCYGAYRAWLRADLN